MILIDSAVGQDQDICSVPVSSVCFYKKTIDRFLKACIFIIGNRNHAYMEAVFIHGFDLHQIGIGQNRIVDLDHMAVFRFFQQQISVFSDISGCRGDNFLTDRIDWRVGYLRK